MNGKKKGKEGYLVPTAHQMLLPTRQQTRTKLSKVNEYSIVVEQLDYGAKPFILKYNPTCFHVKIESESASHSNT